jgi:DNA-binding XRE family transcriptional regulator
LTTYPGERNPNAVLTAAKVREIRKLYQEGDHTQRQLGRLFGANRSTIGQVLRHTTWRHVR